MKKDRIWELLALLLLIALCAVFAYVLLRRVLPVFLPFIIAFVVASAMRRPASRISRKIRIPERVVRLVLSLASVLFIFLVVSIFVWRVSTTLFEILTGISDNEEFLRQVLSIFNRELPMFDELPDELYDRVGEAFGAMISGALSSVASFLSAAVARVPGIVLFITVTVISLIYFSLDIDRVISSVSAILPKGIKSRITDIKDNVASLVLKYIKSYFVILLITFGVISAGLLILRVENAVFWAFIIALLDILPVIGVGTVLIPWSIFAFFSGDAVLGVGLIVLFFVNSVVRQFSEPRILGKNLDLHPILTLMLVYSGYALLGIAGVVLLPIIGVVVGVYLKKNAASEVTENAPSERNDA